jgi:hypothetical protein
MITDGFISVRQLPIPVTDRIAYCSICNEFCNVAELSTEVCHYPVSCTKLAETLAEENELRNSHRTAFTTYYQQLT